MSAEAIKLKLVHRFRSGTLGTLVLSCDERGPVPAEFFWNGPAPRLGDRERQAWEQACFARFADRSGQAINYVALLKSGKHQSWLFERGKKPRRVPLAEAFAGPAVVLQPRHSIEEEQ
jgi:hypothetical protein